MCWAWRGSLKMCWQRSLTNSSLTWRAEGSNPTQRHLPTHRLDTHTTTHRSEPLLFALTEDWQEAACSSPSECSGNCLPPGYCVNRRWHTRKWALNFVPCPPSDYWSSVLFFYFLWFIRLSNFSWRETANLCWCTKTCWWNLFNEQWASDCFMSTLTAGRFKRSCCGSNLCLSVVVSISISGQLHPHLNFDLSLAHQ